MARDTQREIIFFTKYTRAGASSRYRSFQYFPFYRNAGYTVIAKPLIPDTYIHTFYRTGKKPFLLLVLPYIRRFFQVLFLNRNSIIYLEYELFPYLPYFIEAWLLRRQKKLVIDYDDAIFHNYDRSSSHVVRWMLSKKIYKLARLANVVITGSPYLTASLKKYAAVAKEIPTSIVFEKYQEAETEKAADSKEPFILGWIGSKTTSYNLGLIAEAVKSIQQEYKLELTLVGFDHQQEQLLRGLKYTVYPWDEETEIQRIRRFDAGIMPLENNDFNKGKCGFKLIQYMACGKPTIATPLPANQKINHDNHNLFATSTAEWIASIKELIANKEYYSGEVGVRNKELVKQFYSAEANAPRYLDIFETLNNEV